MAQRLFCLLHYPSVSTRTGTPCHLKYTFCDLLLLFWGSLNKANVHIVLIALPPLHCVFQSQDVYSSYRDVTPESFAEVLLRTGKLAEAKTEGQTPFPATEGKHC